MRSKPDLLILVNYGTHGETDTSAAGTLVNAVSEHLDIPVQTAFLEGNGLSVGESIQAGVVEHQPECVVVLPLFLGASAAKWDNVRLIVDAAKDRWPEIGMIYGEPLGAHPGVISAYRHLLDTALQDREITALSKTALLVVGRGSRSADYQAHVQEMARCIAGDRSFCTAETALHGKFQPDMQAGIERCVQADARRVLILPYLLYETALYQTICQQAQHMQSRWPEREILIAPPLSHDDGILSAITQRYQEALTTLAAQRSGTASNPYRLPHSHGRMIHTHPVSPPFEDGIQALLPPRYQNGETVSAAPMGAADLVFDVNGQVAWDQIWGSFCDLALAGGPPHRSTLLEPVSPEVVAANHERYQTVVAELTRGIGMITHLPVAASSSPGWISIQCTDEAMALWLLRAIVVENISVRREGTFLYLPAGPDFRLEYEIKNVITVVAKTHHYWIEHINGSSQD